MDHFLLFLWEYMWSTFSMSQQSSSLMPSTLEVRKCWTDSSLLIYIWSPGDQSWLQQSIYQRAPNGLHDAFSPPLKSSDTPSKQLRSSSLKLKSKICADLNNKIFEICFDFNIIFVWTKVLKSRRLPITRPKLVTVEVHIHFFCPLVDQTQVCLQPCRVFYKLYSWLDPGVDAVVPWERLGAISRIMDLWFRMSGKVQASSVILCASLKHNGLNYFAL